MQRDDLECVIVCDNYSDRLIETLPYTRRHVDRLVVVTGEDDAKTQALCTRFDVRCIPTYVHKRETNGRRTIDKSAAINHGLRHLACDGWLLQLDADVVIPDRFSDWLAEHPLDKSHIYGVDRYDMMADAWDKIKNTDWMHDRREWGFMIHPPRGVDASHASRVGHGAYSGWIPIGFFQLWHGSKVTRYPWKPNADAEHTDALHAFQWPKEKRTLIPDFFVLHLVSSLEMGIDWHGRKSPAFRPEAEHVGHRHHHHHGHHHHHHHKPPEPPYCG